MKKVKIMTTVYGTPGCLKNDFEYRKDGRIIVVKKDTKILVDIHRHIALIGDDHCQLIPEDYQVSYLN